MNNILPKIFLRISIPLFLVCIDLVGLNAQFAVKIKKSEFKKEEHGFKEAWSSIKLANKQFKAGVGAYRDARENYLKAYEYNSENPELNYMIGKCYLFTDDKFESIKYIQKAYTLDNEVSFDIHFMLGMAFHQILEFDKAIEEYTIFQRKLDPKLRERYNRQIEQLIKQCRHGNEIVAEPVRVVINNLGRTVNSVFDEYGPVLTGNADQLYFTSRRMYGPKSERSKVDYKFYEDIYYSELKGNEWSRARRVDTKITSRKNNTNIAVVGVSPDNTRLYVYQGDENNGDLFVSEFKKDKWTNPKPLSKFNTKFRELSICFNSDESKVFFVSTDDKEGYGGSDIYMSEKNFKGKWGKPQNIGNVVNSFYDEIGVSLSANDSILYFSSKGHNSMGGYDVFKSTISDVGLWSKPINLGYPINTPNDDIFYREMPDRKSALYSTIRESGIGGFDIYKIIMLGSEKQLMLTDVVLPVAGVVKPYDDIYFEPPAKLNIDTSIVMRGFISDSENQDPIMGKLEIIDKESSSVIATALSDSTGNYLIHIPESKEYGVEIVARGYLLYLDMVDLSYHTYDEVFVRNFVLDRVEVGAKMVLKNIYFETGKATLKEESYATLNAVVRLMQNNPTLRLEISGHTDNVGSAKYNLKLSNDRAKACTDYLVKQGINTNRLEYKGYGFQSPIVPNDTPENRAKNRRVEFKVLSK